MDFNELKVKYRLADFWKRIWIGAALIVSPFAIDLGEAVPLRLEEREQSALQRDAASAKLVKAQQQRDALPELEERLAFTLKELERAKAKLPDQFFIDEILHKTAQLAEETGIKLFTFDPGEETPSETAFRYVTLPIDVELSGSFGQIATFFDRIVHLPLLVHVANAHLHAVQETLLDNKAETDLLSAWEKHKRLRQQTKIAVRAQLVVFRSLSDAEFAGLEKINPSNLAEENKAEEPGEEEPPPAAAEGTDE